MVAVAWVHVIGRWSGAEVPDRTVPFTVVRAAIHQALAAQVVCAELNVNKQVGTYISRPKR